MPRYRRPLREQAFRIAIYVIAMVVGIAVAVALNLGHHGHRPLNWTVVVIVLAIAIVVAVAAMIGGLAIGRRLVGDRIEVAFRETGQTRWRHGRLTVSPGHVTLEPYTWQVRVPSGEHRDYEVDSLSEDTGRRPPLRQIWSVNPQLHIVTLTTDTDILELAAFPSRITELRERLAEPAAAS